LKSIVIQRNPEESKGIQRESRGIQRNPEESRGNPEGIQRESRVNPEESRGMQRNCFHFKKNNDNVNLMISSIALYTLLHIFEVNENLDGYVILVYNYVP